MTNTLRSTTAFIGGSVLDSITSEERPHRNKQSKSPIDYSTLTTTFSTGQSHRITQELFLDLLSAGFMEIQSVDQLLCTNCDRFLADRFVEGTCPHLGCGYEDARGDQCDGCGKLVNAIELVRPRCKICSSAPVIRQSNQFFINLPLVC